MGSSAQDGENEQYLSYFFFLELYCGQTVWFFEVSSTVLKRFCPLQSKNTSVLVLAIFFGFLKILCFCPKIKFFDNLWRSRATKPSPISPSWAELPICRLYNITEGALRLYQVILILKSIALAVCWKNHSLSCRELHEHEQDKLWRKLEEQSNRKILKERIHFLWHLSTRLLMIDTKNCLLLSCNYCQQNI